MKYKEQKIDFAVIDIRNNFDGNDKLWRNILEILVAEKQISPIVKVGIKNSQRNINYVSRNGWAKQLINKAKKINVPFLLNEEFLVLNAKEILQPSKSSINLKGKIYILTENVYSAAGLLVNYCNYFDQLVSVGKTNPMELGEGFSAYTFSLPNSKIIFSISAAIDLTNSNTAIETLHKNVEVKIAPTLKDVLRFYNFPNNIKTEEFLINYDPFFKKVFELENIKISNN